MSVSQRLDPSSTPAALRDAATVILVRDASGGVEVWLMERARTVGFMASAWVFPGGRVDPADATATCTDPPVPSIPRSFWVAAARELHEEAGVSLAQGEVWQLEKMRVWSHWITPEIEPRRYDTWFFLAELPPGQIAEPDGKEASRGGWFSPSEAAAMSARGELPLAPPTLRTLLELAPYETVAQLLSVERATPPICPRFLHEGETLYVLLPGDPEHPSGDRVDPPHRYAFNAGRWWEKT